MEDEQTKIPVPGTTPTRSSQVEFRRKENVISCYANQVQVESNAFDLKLVFGLYDHRDPAKPIIEQFSSMNLSWPEVKLLIYWMQVHLAGYEKENGKVKIPATAIPPEIPPISPQFDNPKGREVFDMIRKMRAEFLASLIEP